jgi:S-adenosylmethionine:tRNA ribosyltransferase-isomerase
LEEYLAVHGKPIRYAHEPHDHPLSDHQTIFATEPGSAEMPSAGRPFTRRAIAALRARGVSIAKLVLHTGVSSQERGERPYPERYRVPKATAAAANRARRVIAVGTTVVRALETVTDERGAVHAGEGWTSLVVTPERGVRAVDGVITGWHEPDASHLLMLEAIACRQGIPRPGARPEAGRELLERSYSAAVERGYRWHEFGDSHLILPA